MTFITSAMLQAFMDKTCEQNDTKPAGYCNAAMEQVRDYLGYDPEQQTYTQEIKGDDGKLVALCAWPVSTITAFSIDGEIHSPAEVEVESTSTSFVPVISYCISPTVNKFCAQSTFAQSRVQIKSNVLFIFLKFLFVNN